MFLIISEIYLFLFRTHVNLFLLSINQKQFRCCYIYYPLRFSPDTDKDNGDSVLTFHHFSNNQELFAKYSFRFLISNYSSN